MHFEYTKLRVLHLRVRRNKFYLDSEALLAVVEGRGCVLLLGLGRCKK